MIMGRTLMQVRDMTIGHKDRVLFEGVSFDICQGDCIMLCGANGSGKTTLLKKLAASDRNIVMIPTGIPKIKGFTLKEFVRISCFRHSDMGGRLSPEQEDTIDKALERLGLGALASRDISQLSDGEFQKAAIASAFVHKADIILLDEPTAFLDAENRISALETLRSLCDGELSDMTQQGRAVIFSTHDLHEGLAAANKVLALGADGRFHCSSSDRQEMELAVKRIFRTQR